MSVQTTPAPDLSASIPEWLTTEQRIILWAEVTDACEQLLLAGFQREAGSDGDVLAAYRRWYDEQMKEHDRTLVRLLVRLNTSESKHGR